MAHRRDFFHARTNEAVAQGAGSGFVWDKDGHIITNCHVIRGASRLVITLSDQTEYEATVVGVDPEKDIAVLKIMQKAFGRLPKPLPVGTSSNLQVGQKVLAIGNPFGLDQTLTTGVVSVQKCPFALPCRAAALHCAVLRHAVLHIAGLRCATLCCSIL
jgi:S1-C subfamily serine protease